MAVDGVNGWTTEVLTALLEHRRVPTRQRITLAVVCGILAASVTMQKNIREPTPRDFEQVWFAARAVVAGTDP